MDTKNYKENYENAIEIAKQNPNALVKDVVDKIFPELKESEDEKIREWLINYLDNIVLNSPLLVEKESCENALAWLEKQGEQPNKVSIWKHWKNGIAGNGEGKLVYLLKSGNTYMLSSSLGFECDYIELSELDKLLSQEKQGEQKPILDVEIPFGAKDSELEEVSYNIPNGYHAEIEDNKVVIKKGGQKPADKVEPKFKVGDIVVVKPMACHGEIIKGKPFEIVDITEDDYISDNGKSYSISLQDGWELVEQKPVEWSDEDEIKLNDVIRIIENSGNVKSIRKHYIDWLKSLSPQKQQYDYEWSDEDKEFLKLILSNLTELKDRYGEGYGRVGECIKWLNSLQPQPINVEAAIAYQDGYQKAVVEFSQKQQEWTDEDINMIDWLIRCCEKEHEELCNDRYGHQEIVSDLKRDCRKKWDWLESLKGKVAPQKKWKPSEKQMKALMDSIQGLYACKDKNLLFDLYEQLKAL